jgi:hypothetical protein
VQAIVVAERQNPYVKSDEMNNNEIIQKKAFRATYIGIPMSVAIFLISQFVYSTSNSTNISRIGFVGMIIGIICTLYVVYFFIKTVVD